MFIGHFALGFGAKKAAPAVSLGTLFLACQFADLLWPTLVLIGIERVDVTPGVTAMTPLDFVSYPVLAQPGRAVRVGVAVGGVYALARRPRRWRRDRAAGHQPLGARRRDAPARHAADAERPGAAGARAVVPIPATLAGGARPLGAGLALYLRTTSARDRIGSIGLWTLAAFLLIIYAAATFGPPPPSSAAVAWSAEALWLIVVWGYWVDNHRIPNRNA